MIESQGIIYCAPSIGTSTFNPSASNCDCSTARSRPSIDPEVLLRILLIGYLHGITSERRSLDETGLNLAYCRFTGLSFDRSIPDHSTFSKNRHGRFRESSVFRDLFEAIVQQCVTVGFGQGERLSVDGTVIAADASTKSRVPREQLPETQGQHRKIKACQQNAARYRQATRRDMGDQGRRSRSTQLLRQQSHRQ